MLSVQVKFKTILKNITLIKKKLKANTKFCAVVKDNAYGLGLTKISTLLEPYVDCFAVANLQEGITLRHNGIQKDILVFGVTDDLLLAAKHHLTITVNSYQEAHNIIKSNLPLHLHIAINSGLNRFGISSVHELRATLQLLRNAHVDGCYTHLAYEENQQALLDVALEKFKKLATLCKKYFPNLLLHAGCSGTINYQPAHFDLMRIGKALYGGVKETQTAITVTSRIVAIKKIKEGATVGYAGIFTAPKPMVIGVVQGGYAHGIQMNFSGASFVTVDQTICQIVGRVCMDCFFIDVSQVSNPIGKTVTIITAAPGQTLPAVAEKTNTIVCNLLQGFRA